MSIPRRVRITGGPMPLDFRIVDAQTGEAIPGVVAFTVSADVQDQGACMATVTLIAEVDIEVDATVKRAEPDAPPRQDPRNDPGVG